MSILTTSHALRIDCLQPYLLGPIAEDVLSARLRGRDVVDLSQANPDLGPPPKAVDSLVQATLRPHNHRYSASSGISRLRDCLGTWYKGRHHVDLDPASEIVVTMGSKEGLAHLLLAAANPGDTVLIPTPSYPIHSAAIFLAGAGFIGVPIHDLVENSQEERGLLSSESHLFFERLEASYRMTYPRPKFVVVSFPHNPTTAVVDLSFWDRLVSFARRHDVFLIHDFAYSTICFDDYLAPSLLEVPGAKDVAVELFSLSKSFGIPGWRVGFAVGNAKLISALKKIKSYIDFGIFQPLQIAACEILEEDNQFLTQMLGTYSARRDVLAHGLKKMGWEFFLPKATVFIWAAWPKSLNINDSMTMCRTLLEGADLAACPGVGFGEGGDRRVRFSLVESEKRIRQGLRKMQVLADESNHGGGNA